MCLADDRSILMRIPSNTVRTPTASATKIRIRIPLKSPVTFA